MYQQNLMEGKRQIPSQQQKLNLVKKLAAGFETSNFDTFICLGHLSI